MCLDISIFTLHLEENILNFIFSTYVFIFNFSTDASNEFAYVL